MARIELQAKIKIVKNLKNSYSLAKVEKAWQEDSHLTN